MESITCNTTALKHCFSLKGTAEIFANSERESRSISNIHGEGSNTSCQQAAPWQYLIDVIILVHVGGVVLKSCNKLFFGIAYIVTGLQFNNSSSYNTDHCKWQFAKVLVSFVQLYFLLPSTVNFQAR